MTESERKTGLSIRLSPRWWCVVLVVWLVTMWLAPRIGERWENLSPSKDYRTPYAMSEDYWHYERLTRVQAAQEKILMLGESVIWGEYVKPAGSLSSCLNRRTARHRFAG